MAHVLYPDGTVASAGDLVTYLGERSTVEEVITEEQFAAWGLDEPGLMLVNASFGRVFAPAADFPYDVVFLSRAT